MSGDDLGFRKLWQLLGWVMVVAVIYLSLVPSPPPLAARHADKVGHFVAYAAMMFWFGCLYAGRARSSIALSRAFTPA